MNKQEVIATLQSKAVNHYSETSGWTKEIELDIAIDIIAQINEPEKPVIPQFVADMIIERKKLKQGIVTAIKNLSVYKGASAWVRKNEEAFEKAWFFGYEVEREKLFTAKLKSTNEYLHYDKDYKEIHHFKVPDDVANQAEAYHFIEDDLIKYRAWENEAYDVKEVEE
ncbi:DUF1642 domain-containing protein [Streptococcus gallolyticus]|uniref:DUF1642 domain-containing protein n=1 Tax=Streptococcus gallolyticus TaxID=315405 RepID=UPI0034A21E12